MRAQQTGVSSRAVLSRIRSLVPFIVVMGKGFEADIARQLNMPGHSAADLAATVDQLVDEGKLRVRYGSMNLGQGGVANDDVSEDVKIYTIM